MSKTVLDGANSTKFLTCWVSLQSSHANFQNIFVSPNIADILNFRIFAKHKNAYILKSMLDRADCADFGCHNSIRLETKHFLNTLALTFISFSGRFVFAMQKHYLSFCERSSSSNWTLIVLSLPIQEDSKAQQKQKKVVDKISVSRDRREVKHHGEHQGMIQTKVGMLWCTGSF